MAHYEEMDYQLTGCAEPEDTEMCCMIAAELAPTDTEMSEGRVHRPAEESDDEDEIPPPPILVRQNATAGPVGRHGLSLREQELRYIAEHGLVDFCNGAIVTAILQDADYLLAQLTYLRR